MPLGCRVQRASRHPPRHCRAEHLPSRATRTSRAPGRRCRAPSATAGGMRERACATSSHSETLSGHASHPSPRILSRSGSWQGRQARCRGRSQRTERYRVEATSASPFRGGHRYRYILQYVYYFVEVITSSATPYLTAASALIQKSRSISALTLSIFWPVFFAMISARRSLSSRASRSVIS